MCIICIVLLRSSFLSLIVTSPYPFQYRIVEHSIMTTKTTKINDEKIGLSLNPKHET
jgi:hypothetical protein